MPDGGIRATPCPFRRPGTSPVRDPRTAGRIAPRSGHEPLFRRSTSLAGPLFPSPSLLHLPAVDPIAKIPFEVRSRAFGVSRRRARRPPRRPARRRAARPGPVAPSPSSSTRHRARTLALACALENPPRKNGAFCQEMALMFQEDDFALRTLRLSLFSFFFPSVPSLFMARSNPRPHSACSNAYPRQTSLG